MSNYTEFERDYPNRCLRILADYEHDAEYTKLEVTFLLTIATGMICMIADRIGLAADERDEVRNHPTGKSRVKSLWDEYSKSLDESLQARIENDLIAQMKYSMPVVRRDGEPADRWEWVELPQETSLRTTFCLIRNALAHGNIWTEAGPSGEIARIILAAKCDAPEGTPKPYEAVRLPPAVLRRLLQVWASLFGGVNTPPRRTNRLMKHSGPR
jgi:hypothetical protein